ncbi:MAG: ECF-type sigma factor [Acidobacteriota bacterium]
MHIVPMDLTLELNRWAAGGVVDGDLLFDSVYRRLQVIAKSCLRREPADVLQQTTALVHEAYLNLSKQPGLSWKSREHFFSFAARMMRRILVDQARHKYRAKRGSRSIHLSLEGLESRDEPSSGSDPDQAAIDILDLNRVLDALGKIDPSLARLVEMRYFCGLSVPEVATILGTSESTVFRQWRLAKGWLYDALQQRSHA